MIGGADIHFRAGAGIGLVYLEAVTEEGEAFVDAYMPPQPEKMYALDVGTIVIALDDLVAFRAEATRAGLEVVRDVVRA